MTQILYKDSHGNDCFLDTATRLLQDRIVLLNGEINSHMNIEIITQLLCLSANDSKKPIQLWIQSQGGECNAGLAIIDVMKKIEAPVHTYGLGQVASMATIILAAGERGNRFAFPNTEIMIHEVSSGIDGRVELMLSHAEQTKRVNERILHLLSEYTGQTTKVLHELMRVDKFLTPEGAKKIGKFGLIDNIISSSTDTMTKKAKI